jgi:PAS domain-containing protein
LLKPFDVYAVARRGILTSDRGRIVFVNRAARDLFGGGERIEGRRYDEIAEQVPALAEALQSGESAVFTKRQRVKRRSTPTNRKQHAGGTANRQLTTDNALRAEIRAIRRC